MIPTTVTSSTSPATAAGSINSNSNTPSGSSSNNNGQQNSSSTLMIGIASLILEGRAISEDEYQQPLQRTATCGSGVRIGTDSGSGSAYASAGRQSPKPSTSRAATCAAGSTSSGHVINITTNPQAFHHYAPLYIDSSVACSSAESTRQRLSQKLCQLRQASPTVSLGSTYEQAQNATAVESELLAVGLDSSIDELEIRHRVMLQRVNVPGAASIGGGGSASSSPGSGSENFLHSLQSLATTCLRGGSPPMEHHNSYRYPTLCASPVSPPLLATASPKYSSYRATPPRYPSPYAMEMLGSGSSNGSGIQSPRPNWYTPTSSFGVAAGAKEAFERQALRRLHMPPATATLYSSLATAAAVASSAIEPTMKAASATTTAPASASSTNPQQGPHCDQFLRKMGLAKGEAAEAEDHICDMSYVNITCSRWRAHCLKMEAIMARGETICIEVYLGPVGHKILLEQWIITQKEKIPPPTMTLPSLCSAIRSQLYFSQISAWCDLIKKSDKTIYDTGRIIIPTSTGAAGDLVTSASASAANAVAAASSSTLGTSPSTSASPLQTMNAMLNRRPRLNIFYRIKQYDSTACFNSKPNVHNFPNVNITENCSISVCLKSLPRINGGIPKVGTGMSTSSEVSAHVSSPSPNGSAPPASNNGAAPGTPMSSRCPGAAPPPNCDSKTERTAMAATAPATAIANTARTATAATAAVTSAVAACSSNGAGKFKCKFFIDEEELLDANFCADAGDDDDSVSDTTMSGAGLDSSNSSFSSNANANLSHRERQLLKYRKRMLKRDKKRHRKPLCTASEASCEMVVAELQQQRSSGEPAPAYQPMEQSEEETHTTSPMARGCVQMISTGTQTPSAACCQCGTEKALVCLKCNMSCANGAGDGDGLLLKRDEMGSSSSISSSDIIQTPRNKAELLLQAIQRTPKTAKHKKKCLRAAPSVSASSAHGAPITSQNNNQLNMPQPGAGASCQVCKRQKTQHNFSARAENAEELVADEQADEGDGSVDVVPSDNDVFEHETATQLMEEEEEPEECYSTSTKLTPFIEAHRPNNCASTTSCVAAGKENTSEMRSCTPPANEQATAAQFRTPTNNQQQQKLQPFQHKQTPKPNLLQITCNYQNRAGGDANCSSTLSYDCASTPPHHNPLLLRKGLPKVNLTSIFCNPAATTTATASASSPIPISFPPAATNAFCFDAPTTTANGTLHASCSAPAVIVIDNNNIPVQKSFSAPTLPNSPSLSPRFAKQAAIYKRRSRHLSDRSDRSSLGSDEQFSDEDLENGMYSPATSPMKNRTRIAATFGRLPLLGNLEEALLQKRIMPKVEVLGFKVLLGASGGFCPTQLTIPAGAFFYELHGETLSTPYLCEIRLPRKGYSVPRAGTVQATLLNPMGTVVRMFVIPYDMRDMPPLHQTFIRQRILAEASANETMALQSNNDVKSAELFNVLNGCGGGDKQHPMFNTNNNNNYNNNCNNNNGNGNKANNSTKNNNNSNINNNNNNKYRLSPSGGLHGESNLGHFISAEHMKRLRYSIHLRFQTSRSGRLSLHTDIRLLISRRTDCDTAAAHAKGALEAPNDLVTDTVMPTNPKYSSRQESSGKI